MMDVPRAKWERWYNIWVSRKKRRQHTNTSKRSRNCSSRKRNNNDSNNSTINSDDNNSDSEVRTKPPVYASFQEQFDHEVGLIQPGQKRRRRPNRAYGGDFVDGDTVPIPALR